MDYLKKLLLQLVTVRWCNRIMEETGTNKQFQGKTRSVGIHSAAELPDLATFPVGIHFSVSFPAARKFANPSLWGKGSRIGPCSLGLR